MTRLPDQPPHSRFSTVRKNVARKKPNAVWKFLRTLRRLWHSLQSIWVPKEQLPKFWIERKYLRTIGQWPDLESPKTLNEKIQWLKLYYHNPLLTTLADKYTVRDYVAGKIGEEHLIPLIGVYENVAGIDFEQLPEKFILKATHGCGWNMICKDKQSFDIAGAKRKLEKWLNTNFYDGRFEWQYKDMKPRIICETLLERPDGKALHDYKILFLNGKLCFIQVVTGRGERSKFGLKPANVFFSTDWELLPIRYPFRPHVEDIADIPKPKQLDQMIGLAYRLCPDVPVVRVDLYLHEEKVYFGELTFTPRSGLFVWEPEEYNRTLGDMLVLPIRQGYS